MSDTDFDQNADTTCDYSAEEARNLALAATFTEADLDASAAAHDAGRDDEEPRCDSE